MKHFLRHLLIPHESNNHRAKILHLDSMLIVIALLIFSSFILSSVQNRFPTVLGISYNITPIDLLNSTNQIRQGRGLSPLTLDVELSQAASKKAADMFAKNYWAHIAPDGVTPWVFIKNSGYEYLYAGENLARGFSNTTDVVNAWMASPTHRDNILSPNYHDIGFGIATGKLTGSDTVLIVEMFGSRYTAQAATIIPSPTSTPDANQREPEPTIAALVTPIPSQIEQGTIEVAALKQQPLMDKNNFAKNIIIIILVGFIAILAIDAIIIERKKIIRVVSHNLDHIIYLIIILLSIIILGKGLVL